MNERQINLVRVKIDKIKKALAADKRRWGGQYDDSRGLRYLPPEHYLKIQDYSGALKYFNWFQKNFPDDMGHPDFLFEWTIALYKCAKFKEAEKKVFTSYFSNTYYFNAFFSKAIVPTVASSTSNWESPEMAKGLIYSSSQPELSDFSIWLQEVISSERFKNITNTYSELKKQLANEPVGPRRSELVGQLSKLKYGK